MRWCGIGVCLLVLVAFPVHAGEVEIVQTVFTQQGRSWRVDTTLRHADTGWEHYADAWRVVAPDGTVLGTRVLFHPHEHEQPFTRSLGEVVLPPDTSVVYVEARDKVHGWGKQRVRVDIRQPSGDRFRVKR